MTVTKRISSTPKRQIVQIDDWHVVRRDHFIISQRANNPQLTDAEIDAAYTKHLAEVEAVQAEQLAVLRHLIRDHAVQTVYLEGFAVEEIDVLTALLVASKHELASEFAMELGAAGKLWKAGELKNVLPAETRESLNEANPFRVAGVDLNAAASKSRHQQIVRQLKEPISVVVLGAAHDLSEVLSDDVTYIRVRPKSVAAMLP